MEIPKFGAREHRPAITRKKDADSGVCSEQDDKRFRFHLGRPRAAAHSWGKVARIRTEINRLPRPTHLFQGKNEAIREVFRQFCSWNEHFYSLWLSLLSVYLTWKNSI
jgi:hypothetical protein